MEKKEEMGEKDEKSETGEKNEKSESGEKNEKGEKDEKSEKNEKVEKNETIAPAANATDNDKLCGSKSIKEFVENGCNLIVQATKHGNVFPSGPTKKLYAAYPTFNKIVKQQSTDILTILSNILQAKQIKGNILQRDQDEKFELLLEYNDAVLEQINSTLDDIAGIRKTTDEMKLVEPKKVEQTNNSGNWNDNKLNKENTTTTPTAATTTTTTAAITTTTTSSTNNRLAKINVHNQGPINCKFPVDNTNETPFKPLLVTKPNALRPLQLLPKYNIEGTIIGYYHPYEYELNHFQIPANQLTPQIPIEPKKLVETPLTLIDSEEQLNELFEKLSNEPIIGIDLEHHSYRSYQGITCLMQISSRNDDFIIDTLALHGKLMRLNEIFTDPKILKVFHGADMDVEWLQRDLGLYVVNMFDTHQAAKRLGHARLSLQFLAKHYCNINIDKSFQLADWRVRPLPDAFLAYGRQDTHYLIYIYQRLTNELIEKANGQLNLLNSVYHASLEICKKRYIKPVFDEEGYIEFYRKSKRVFNNRQILAMACLYRWRDITAREEDESCGYVLPNHMLFQIAENLPREVQGVLACCNPVPPLLRQHVNRIHTFILASRAEQLAKELPEELRQNRTSALTKNKDLSGILFCPHDIITEFRNDLPTLLGSNEKPPSTENEDSASLNPSRLVEHKPQLTAFLDTSSESTKSTNAKVRELNEMKFISPYARYLAILPMVEQQRLEDLKKAEEINKKKRLCPEKNADEEFIKEKIEGTEDEESSNKRKRNPNFESSSPTTTTTITITTPTTISSAQKNAADTTEQEVANKKMKLEEKEEQQQQQQPSTATKMETETDPSDQSHKLKHKKSKKKKKNKSNDCEMNESSEIGSNEFDFNTVNFDRFAGGSVDHTKTNPNQVTTKYHGKSKGKKFGQEIDRLLGQGNGKEKGKK